MTGFFEDMVDTENTRFYALCFPSRGERHHQQNPIRDLAAAWDASKALVCLKEKTTNESTQKEKDLRSTILNTVLFYQSALILTPGHKMNATMLDSKALNEPSNIAHSALMILASMGASELSLFPEYSPPIWIDGLVQGILAMQRPDGAFCVTFGNNGPVDSNVYPGIEFYPGEAMVALMEAYKEVPPFKLADSTRNQIVPAMERAFVFYSDLYQQGNAAINYNIWQIQAFSRLFHVLLHHDNFKKAEPIASYVLNLCEGVITSKAWKYELARGQSFYPNLDTVEIACGLDALADGIGVAKALYDSRLESFRIRAKDAVYFLEWSHDQVPTDVSVGRGGLGYGGVLVLEQRLDVTGHALSALSKLQ